MGYISNLKCHFKSIKEKNLPGFLCGAFLWCVPDETFIEVHLFQEISRPEKFLGCAPELTSSEQSILLGPF